MFSGVAGLPDVPEDPDIEMVSPEVSGIGRTGTAGVANTFFTSVS